MTTHNRNHAFGHKKIRPKKRSKKKHTKLWPGRSLHVLNGQREEKKMKAREADSKNEISTPPIIVSGSNARQHVEFVYPRGKNTELVPFKFERPNEKIKTTDEVQHSAKSPRLIDDKNSEGVMTNESIEDILYSKKKPQDPAEMSATKEIKRQRVSEDRQQKHDAELSASKSHTLPGQTSQQSKTSANHLHRSATLKETDSYGGQLSGLSVEDAVRDKYGSRPRANSTDGELNLPRRGLCDERMVLESHRWKLDGKKPAPKGLCNLGNTCFLNATLQCLAYLPTFCQCLTKLPAKSNVPRGNEFKGQKLMTHLSHLLRQIHSMDGHGNVGHAIAPRAIVNAIPSIGGKSYKFRPGRQEDAHEFLVHLLDTMKDGELKAAGVNQNISGWRERLPIPRLDETTLIHRIFGGYLRSQISCTSCGNRSNTYDPFLDLALEVSKKSSNSVASAFSEFTRKETLDSANRWKCSGCKQHVCASKQLTVFRPPLSLCIQLKRFSFGGGFGGFSWEFGHYGGHSSARGGSKITKPIDFPSELKLPLSDGRTCEYNLTGIIIHVGGSASSGHYTAYVRKPSGQGGNQWYHIDDSFVQAVSERTVLQQRHAYVLFYCRREVKLEFPSPPPRGSMSASEARQLGASRARARADSLTKENEALREFPQKSVASESTTTGRSGNPREPIGITRFVVSQDSSESDSSSSSSSTSPDSENSPKSSDKETTKEVVATTARETTRNEGVQPQSSVMDKGEGGTTPADDASTTSSSSSSDSSSDSSSSDDEDEEKPSPSSSENMKAIKPDKSPADDESSERREAALRDGVKQKVVLDQGSRRGKLEVMLGPRSKSKAWKPQAVASKVEDQKEQQLLGNIRVGKWDDDDSLEVSAAAAHANREKAVKQLKKKERSRKRSMHLDRWDAKLDEGKKKKVKSKQSETLMGNVDPRNNPYHRIQSSIQRMNRGRAKGSFHQKDKSNTPKRPAYRHASRRR